MACGLALIIALMTVIGRVSPLEIFMLSIIGTILYELNDQILWRLFVTDCGYGMRVFVFGGVLGLTSSLILFKRETTEDHPKYISDYFSQTYSLLGSAIVWIFFPVLILADTYRSGSGLSNGINNQSTDNIILPPAILNTFLAGCASAVSAFSASMLFHNRIAVQEIIYSIYSVFLSIILGNDRLYLKC